MAKIVLKMQSEHPTLNAVGDVFLSPYDDGEAPVVDDVFVRSTRSSRFVLEDEGEHQYRFYLQDGFGVCTLSAEVSGQGAPFKRQEFDTSVAVRGLIFRFTPPKVGT